MPIARRTNNGTWTLGNSTAPTNLFNEDDWGPISDSPFPPPLTLSELRVLQEMPEALLSAISTSLDPSGIPVDVATDFYPAPRKKPKEPRSNYSLAGTPPKNTFKSFIQSVTNTG